MSASGQQEDFFNISDCKGILSLYGTSVQFPIESIEIKNMIRGEEPGDGRAAGSIKCTVAADGYITNYRDTDLSVRGAIAVDGGPLISLGEGYVENAKVEDNGTQTLEAYSAERRLRQNYFYGNYDSTPVTEVLADVFQQAGVRGDATRISSEGPDTDNPEGQFVSFDFKGETCLEVIGELAGQNGASWFIDNRNKVWVVDELYGTPVPNHSFKQGETLTGIEKSNPGPKTDMYQRVIVHGGSPPRNSTQNRSNGSPSTAPTTSPPLGWAETDDFQENPQKYETFEVTDVACYTPEMAQNMAESILLALFQKQIKGKVTMSGDATLKPFDYISMPNNDKYNGEQYLISGVEHTVDTSKGFKTIAHLSPVAQTTEDSVNKGGRLVNSNGGQQ